MSSPSVQFEAPANLDTKKYCLSTVVRMSKKLLGGICISIWKLLTVLLFKAGIRIISHHDKVADAEAAIHALKAQLVTQFAQFETERKLHKDREAKLRQQLEYDKSKFLKHEWRKPYLECLAEVGAAVRCRALEHSKGSRIFGGSKDEFSNIRGKVDIKIIEKGNVACHRGNIKADVSLYKLGYRCAEMDEAFFRSIYYLGPLGLDPGALLSRKWTEALNLRGTMSFCFSFTEASRSSCRDTQFSSLLRQIYIMMNDARKEHKPSNLFDADPEVEQKMILMRKIAEEVSILDKRWRNRRRDIEYNF